MSTNILGDLNIFHLLLLWFFCWKTSDFCGTFSVCNHPINRSNQWALHIQQHLWAWHTVPVRILETLAHLKWKLSCVQTTVLCSTSCYPPSLTMLIWWTTCKSLMLCWAVAFPLSTRLTTPEMFLSPLEIESTEGHTRMVSHLGSQKDF